MKKIIILLDYKGRFSSKWAAKPYCSGMDLNKIEKNFNAHEIEVEFMHYTEVNFRERDFKGEIVLYTSSEDDDLRYKSYIEDVVYALELQGTNLLPSYTLLKAHHNKVFMELLRDLSSNDAIKNIRSQHFGTKEDYFKVNHSYPEIIKGAAGAVSSSVFKIDMIKEVNGTVSRVARSKAIKYEIRDELRAMKHSGYVKESRFRNKFVTQNFISGLNNDWKIIVFGEKYFILERTPKEDDFRASGSGIIKYPEEIPAGLLDYAESIFTDFNVPFFAMDIGFNGSEFCLIEFQALYFGTHTVDTAPFYFCKIDGEWKKNESQVEVETELVTSVASFLKAYF